ncbi:MAG: type II secretion system protein GspG [Candidatus Omnitrophica bacterium]|nr:type II secretion system protein GspG [Candidatus Omnitrophota bacterium]
MILKRGCSPSLSRRARQEGGKMKKGFTLIELIVVIAIIAILAAIIAPNAFKAIEKAKITEAVGDFKTYKTALYTLYADTGKWGTDAHYSGSNNYVAMDNYTELIEDPGGMAGWDGPYLDKLKGKTPWEGTYVMQASNCTGGAAKEIWLEFENNCYDGSGNNCDISDATAEKLDEKVDDGDLTTGLFRQCGSGANWCYCSGDDTIWVVVEDAL